MSDFYAALSSHYDRVFPLDPSMLAFLEQEFGDCSRLLDAACGTGAYSLALAASRQRVVGLDLDPAMIGQATAKLDSASSPLVEFRVADMLESSMLVDSGYEFDGLFCIGNSLVHLPNESVVAAALASFHQSLAIGGRLVIQIVNYDRVLDRGVKELPELRGPGVRFLRRYMLEDDRAGCAGRQVGGTGTGGEEPRDLEARGRSCAIIFDTELHLEGPPPAVHRQRTDLLALRSADLAALAREAGFDALRFYGSYSRDDYEAADSFLAILCAERVK